MNPNPARPPSPYLVSLSVDGEHRPPAPQGSKTPTGRYRTSKAGKAVPVLRESSRNVKPWRAAVAETATEWLWRLPTALRHLYPIDGPLVAYMVFTVKAPQRKRGDEAPAADRTPDLSKLLRSTEDALTKVLWKDDGRVVGYDLLWKTYPGMHADALDRPGAVIRIRRATHTELGLVPGSPQHLKYTGLLEQWAHTRQQPLLMGELG